jgi:hypothetical protein
MMISIRLRQLEMRLEQVFPITTAHTSLLRRVLSTISTRLAKALDDRQDLFQPNCFELRRDLMRSKGLYQKKAILKNQLFYLTNYVNHQKNIHWEESYHTDILYIYRYSKQENDTKEKIMACLSFLEEAIAELEKLPRETPLAHEFLVFEACAA